MAIGTWMTALCVYDLRERRLPNSLTLPGAAVILLAAVVLGRGLAALAGAAALCALYLLIHLLSPKSMGGGDVKLALGLGAVTGVAGAQTWLTAAVGAFALTAAVGVCQMLLGRAEGSLPHGPSMCVASLLAVALVP